MIDIREIISDAVVGKLAQKEMPEWMDPMLATLYHDVFSDENWIYERKLDGERCLIFKNGDDVRLLSRNRKELSFRYPGIKEAFSSMETKRFIADGEIVTFDGKVTSFSKLQKRMHLSSEKEARESEVEVYYYAFDIMYADRYDLTGLPLMERKSILKRALAFEEPIRYTSHRNEDGLQYFKEACDRNWEGLIAKRADSEYLHTRSRKWLKLKCGNNQEFVIVGYTDPKGTRIGFGALLLGYYADDKLKYAGKVGTGYKDDFLKSFSKKLKDLEMDQCPLEDSIPSDGVHWVEPRLVGEVSFTEWTDDGRLRHPSFKGLRDDKNPGDVVREDLNAEGARDDGSK